MPRVDRPVLVLLPEPLERFVHRGLVEELLATGLTVVADPPRVPYRRQAAFADAVARRQARRLRKRLRGDPRAVLIFTAAQYPLAHWLLELLDDGELWLEHSAAPVGELEERLHRRAAARARLLFVAADRDALENALHRVTDPAG